METMEIASHMRDEATKEKTQEVGDWEIREEVEDVDIGDLDLEGIEQACADVGKRYVSAGASDPVKIRHPQILSFKPTGY